MPGQRRSAEPDPFEVAEAYVRQRLAEDPHHWATALFDEAKSLGYRQSYVTFARKIRSRQLRPSCGACGGTRGQAVAMIDHPAGEECQWDWLDMLARNDLGSWLWRQNPNPDRPNHSQLGWAPARDYNEPPEMLGVMIHPLYLWHPDGEPAGYPAANLHP